MSLVETSVDDDARLLAGSVSSLSSRARFNDILCYLNGSPARSYDLAQSVGRRCRREPQSAARVDQKCRRGIGIAGG